jgi:hypothetical protein
VAKGKRFSREQVHVFLSASLMRLVDDVLPLLELQEAHDETKVT